jgi:hypothetical protein
VCICKWFLPILEGKIFSSSKKPWTQFMRYSTYSYMWDYWSMRIGKRWVSDSSNERIHVILQGKRTRWLLPGAETLVAFLNSFPSCQWYS